MNWKSEAINDLILYGKRKDFLDNVDDQLMYLDNDFVALKGCVTDSESIDGGTSKSEDHLINNIIKRDKLNKNKELAIQFVNSIESALNALTQQQRDVLTEVYIDRSKGHIERLMERYHVERTKAYSLRNEALREFTILRSGYIET